ncbi:MAG: helix-turn-helix transcriptional regulator [Methylocella sp.]
MAIYRQRLIPEFEMAKLCAKSCASLRRLRRVGGGPPFVKVGGSVRYSIDSFERFVKQRQVDRHEEAKK